MGRSSTTRRGPLPRPTVRADDATLTRSAGILPFVHFCEQEWAQFGYSGKGRNRRRHHPLVASVAEGRTVVNARYRDGSGVDAGEAIAFFADTVARVRARAPATEVSIRADGGFWSA